MTLSFSAVPTQGSNPNLPNYSPFTGNFAGNPYIVDLDADGFNDIAMADTDVDVFGCNRRAVLLRNVFPTTQNAAQVLASPHGTTLQNYNTVGTHDLAVFDLDGDGAMDVISGLCTGYRAFIQVPPAPTGLVLAIDEPVQGAIDLSVSNAIPNAGVFNLFSLETWTPAGSGPFFGLGSDAFTLFVSLYPGQPIFGPTDGSGVYTFSAPGGSLPAGFQVQARSIQISGATFLQSNVVTKAW
jgi:hypothetical protein